MKDDLPERIEELSAEAERRKRRPESGHEWGKVADELFTLAARARKLEAGEEKEG